MNDLKKANTVKLDFRIDWGYQYLYSRRHYHPFFHWDGTLECSNGVIEKCFKLDYPVIWYGPGQCALETELQDPDPGQSPACGTLPPGGGTVFSISSKRNGRHGMIISPKANVT